MIKAAKYLLWVGILAALATPAFAEPRTISWNPVTTYTDGTPIEAGKTVSYSAYWTTDHRVVAIPPHHRHCHRRDLRDVRSRPSRG